MLLYLKNLKLGMEEFNVNIGSAKKFLYIGCILSIVLFALYLILQRNVFIYICLATAVITAAVWGLYGKCPHCGRFIHVSNYEYCPHCGERIE